MLKSFSSISHFAVRRAFQAEQAGSFRYFRVTPQTLAKLNVEGLAKLVNLEGQNVLMRVDLNVPLSKEV